MERDKAKEVRVCLIFAAITLSAGVYVLLEGKDYDPHPNRLRALLDLLGYEGVVAVMLAFGSVSLILGLTILLGGPRKPQDPG